MKKDDNRLYEKFGQLLRLVHFQHLKKHSSMTDPSRGQGRVIAALKMQSEVSTKDLAYLLGIRTQSLNELLSKLEKKEFITREQSSDDKRIILVKLTEKGRLEKQEPPSFFKIFNCLDEDEQKNLSNYIERIVTSLKDEIEYSDDEQTWIDSVKERFGENFDRLIAMRHGIPPHIDICHHSHSNRKRKSGKDKER